MPQAEVRQTCLLSTEAVVLESRLPPADVLHDVVGSFVDAVEQLLNFQNTAYSFLGLPVLISLLEMELVPLEHVCVSQGWRSHVSLAGTGMGHMPSLWHLFITAGVQCSFTTSISRIGCTFAARGARAIRSFCTIWHIS